MKKIIVLTCLLVVTIVTYAYADNYKYASNDKSKAITSYTDDSLKNNSLPKENDIALECSKTVDERINLLMFYSNNKIIDIDFYSNIANASKGTFIDNDSIPASSGDENPLAETSSNNNYKAKNTLSYLTKGYYSYTETSAAVSASILLMYYDNNKGFDYVNNILEKSLTNGKELIEHISKYIEPNEEKISGKWLENVFKRYLKSRNIDSRFRYYEGSTDKILELIQKSIRNDAPCMLEIIGHPYYESCWVVCTGYTDSAIIVNDIQGNRNVYIEKDYIKTILFDVNQTRY